MSKVAFVTGAGTGIGKAAALAMLKDGYRVALVGRRKELLEKTAQGHEKATLVLAGDITDSELMVLRSAWEEAEPAPRERAWKSVKSVVASGRREGVLEDARARVEAVRLESRCTSGLVGALPQSPMVSESSASSYRTSCSYRLAITGLAAIPGVDRTRSRAAT